MAQDHHEEKDRSPKSRIRRLFKFLYEVKRLRNRPERTLQEQVSVIPLTRCPLCGAQFECGAGEAECWCAALPGLAPIPGRDCLCRSCLEEELKKSSPQRT
jgi:cysteine-rich CWC protein